MSRRAPARFLVLAAIGWSCAYYNGLYNANQLAKDATRARREGRPGEARARWQEVALKAESVAIRFPHSKYRDDALLLQGRALREVDQCGEAIAPLTLASDSGLDPTVRHRALLLLGECQVLLGDPQRAHAALTPLLGESDAVLAHAARVWRARAALARSDYSGALEDLSTVTDTAADFDRVSALIGLGQAPEATALLARRAPGEYDEPSWLGALARLGAVAPADAAILVDSLVRRGNISAGQRARLLVADAGRWERAGNPTRSLQRLEEAARSAVDSAEGRAALVRLTIARIRLLRDPDRLPDLMDQLHQAVEDGGEAGSLAEPVLDMLNDVNDKPLVAPDFSRFLAIERVRDSLGSVPLAAALFRRLQRDFPKSPIAPKALLAAAALEPDSAASAKAMIDSLYPQSAYRLSLEGRDSPLFATLEDSLRMLRDTANASEKPRPSTRPTPGPQRAPLPATGRRVPVP